MSPLRIPLHLSQVSSLALALPWNLPAVASAHGPALDADLSLNLWIAAALLTLAHLILGASFFSRPATEPGSNMRNRTLVEYLPLLALGLLFAFLTFKSERLWASSRYTGAAPDALQVEATGMQFAWYFRYPGADATFGSARAPLVDAGAGNPIGLDPADPHSADDILSSELVLPANREVDLRLQAQDVIHGFFVPSLRLKQNAIPGQVQHIHFTATRPGTYAILCSQLCGLGHFRMSANLRVLAPQEYAAWLHSKESTVVP